MLMNQIIETERLKLTPFQKGDQQLFLKLNNDAFIRKYMWDDELIDTDTAEEIMTLNRKHFEEKQFGLWIIRRHNSAAVIGYTGLWYFFDESQPQLIYALLEEYTGQGYATEASQSIIDYAFNKLDFSYLIAATDEPHTDSQKVALGLGMRFVEKRMENDKPTLFYRIDR